MFEAQSVRPLQRFLERDGEKAEAREAAPAASGSGEAATKLFYAAMEEPPLFHFHLHFPLHSPTEYLEGKGMLQGKAWEGKEGAVKRRFLLPSFFFLIYYYY